MLAFPTPQRHYPALNPFYYDSMHGRQPADMGGDLFRESIRELAQKRARKAQWLPDEVDDSDEELHYSHLGPHERRYLEALKTQQNMDRMRNEYEARATAIQEEAEKLRQAEEERVRKLQMEAQDARQSAIEQMIREAPYWRAAPLDRKANSRLRKQHEYNASTAGPKFSQSRSYSNPSVPIHAERTFTAQSPFPNTSPIPELKSQSPPKSHYSEKHETAASVIQQKFRIHQSLQTVSNIASEFQTLKSAFVYPTVIEFQEPEKEEGHISIPTTHAPSEFDEIEEVVDDDETRMDVNGPQPKLAYTTVNYPVHSYVDATERLLMKLDGVESWGDEGVRERRRSVVREIGKESAKLERYWKQAWIDCIEKQKKEEEQEVEAETIEIDEEPVHVELPKVEDSDEWLDVAELAPVVPNGAKIEIEARPSVVAVLR